MHDEDTYDKLERMLRKLRHTKLRYLLECVCAHLCVRVLCIDLEHFEGDRCGGEV